MLSCDVGGVRSLIIFLDVETSWEGADPYPSGRFSFEDLERLLETLYLVSSAGCPVFVSLWLRDAAIVDPREVLQDGALFLARGVTVGRELGEALR